MKESSSYLLKYLQIFWWRGLCEFAIFNIECIFNIFNFNILFFLHEAIIINVFEKLYIDAPKYPPIYSSNYGYNNTIFYVYHDMKKMNENSNTTNQLVPPRSVSAFVFNCFFGLLLCLFSYR